MTNHATSDPSAVPVSPAPSSTASPVAIARTRTRPSHNSRPMANTRCAMAIRALLPIRAAGPRPAAPRTASSRTVANTTADAAQLHGRSARAVSSAIGISRHCGCRRISSALPSPQISPATADALTSASPSGSHAGASIPAPRAPATKHAAAMPGSSAPLTTIQLAWPDLRSRLEGTWSRMTRRPRLRSHSRSGNMMSSATASPRASAQGSAVRPSVIASPSTSLSRLKRRPSCGGLGADRLPEC